MASSEGFVAFLVVLEDTPRVAMEIANNIE